MQSGCNSNRRRQACRSNAGAVVLRRWLAAGITISMVAAVVKASVALPAAAPISKPLASRQSPGKPYEAQGLTVHAPASYSSSNADGLPYTTQFSAQDARVAWEGRVVPDSPPSSGVAFDAPGVCFILTLRGLKGRQEPQKRRGKQGERSDPRATVSLRTPPRIAVTMVDRYGGFPRAGIQPGAVWTVAVDEVAQPTLWRTQFGLNTYTIPIGMDFDTTHPSRDSSLRSSGRHSVPDGLGRPWRHRGVPFTVEVCKASEGDFASPRIHLGSTTVLNFTVSGPYEVLPLSAARHHRLQLPNQRRIEFLGDSILAGYGALCNLAHDAVMRPLPLYAVGSGSAIPEASAVLPLPKSKSVAEEVYRTSSHHRTMPNILCKSLRADCHTVAFSGFGLVMNREKGAPTMPEVYKKALMTSGNIDWDFSSWRPDVVFVGLGTNDFSMNHEPSWDQYTSTLEDLVTNITSVYYPADQASREPPVVVLLCGPMTDVFCPHVHEVAKRFSKPHTGLRVRVLDFGQLFARDRGHEGRRLLIDPAMNAGAEFRDGGNAPLRRLHEPPGSPSIKTKSLVGCQGHPNAYGNKVMAWEATKLLAHELGWTA